MALCPAGHANGLRLIKDQMACVNFIAWAKDQSPLNHILKFANIAWPGIGKQGLLCSPCQAFNLLVTAVANKHLRHQRQDVVGPLAKPWYGKTKGANTEVQIFTKAPGADLDPFRDWADDRYRHELHSPVVRSGSLRATDRWTAAGCDSGGIDLIGYFGTEVSLANVSRRMQSALAAAGIPHTTTDFRRSGSPRLADAPATVMAELIARPVLSRLDFSAEKAS